MFATKKLSKLKTVHVCCFLKNKETNLWHLKTKFGKDGYFDSKEQQCQNLLIKMLDYGRKRGFNLRDLACWSVIKDGKHSEVIRSYLNSLFKFRKRENGKIVELKQIHTHYWTICLFSKRILTNLWYLDQKGNIESEWKEHSSSFIIQLSTTARRREARWEMKLRRKQRAAVLQKNDKRLINEEHAQFI